MTDTLKAGDTLSVASELISSNGKYRLVMQEDGNLVAYIGQPNVSTAYWATHTNNDVIPGLAGRAARAVMQGDGNFVLYADVPSPNFPVWATGTDGHAGSVIVLQNDANLVIYEPDGTPIWASHTVIREDGNGQPTPRAEVKARQTVDVGYAKHMDSQLTLYRNGGLVADVESHSDNWIGGMRGELFGVIVDGAARAIWATDRFTCTTRGSFWDPFPSHGRDNFFQQLPEPVGRFAERIDIYQMDVLPGRDLKSVRDNFIQIVKGAGDIAAEIKAVRDQLK